MTGTYIREEALEGEQIGVQLSEPTAALENQSVE